jgi:hypothetical protein
VPERVRRLAVEQEKGEGVAGERRPCTLFCCLAKIAKIEAEFE